MLTPGHNYTWYVASVSSPASRRLQCGDLRAGRPGGADADGAERTRPSRPAAGYDQPTFSWTAVAGANHYWLYVVDATNNGAVVVNNNNVSGTSFTLSAARR